MEKTEQFDGTLTMEITDFMLEKVKEVFDIEVMQGTCYKMKNGMNFVEITVEGEKGMLVWKWLKGMASYVRVDAKIMGLPINKN